MKRVLYLGLDPTSDKYIHYPVIRLVPKKGLKKVALFDLCIITSKHVINLLLPLVKKESLQRRCITIGPATTASLLREGIDPLLESAVSTQEGVIAELEKCKKLGRVLYPRSSKARPLLKEYLNKKANFLEIVDLYDTIIQKPYPIPDLQEIDEVVFTSPSTVEGFFSIYSFMPPHIKAVFQGPITEKAFSAATNR